MNNTCFSFQYDNDHVFPSLRITLSVLLGITSVPAVSLNSLILYSIWKNPSLHKPSYLLLANLALADMMFGAIEQPLMIFFHLVYTLKKWKRLYCYITVSTNIVGYWLAFVSLYSLALISIDRLLAIRLKNRYRSFVTSRRIWMVTVPYWVVIFLVLLALLLSNCYLIASNIIFPCYICVFLTIITVCYSMAFYSLKRLVSSVSSSSQQPPANGTNTFDVSQYRRSMNTMILVMLTTILLYLPWMFSAPVFILSGKGPTFILASNILQSSIFFIATNCTVNPLLYLWRMQDIRQAVKITVQRILRREHHSIQHVEA